MLNLSPLIRICIADITPRFVQIFEESVVGQDKSGSYNDLIPSGSGNTSLSSPIQNITSRNVTENISVQEKENPVEWPDWAKSIQCASHFLLTFYSSITFVIYYIKQRTSVATGIIILNIS